MKAHHAPAWTDFREAVAVVFVFAAMMRSANAATAQRLADHRLTRVGHASARMVELVFVFAVAALVAMDRMTAALAIRSRLLRRVFATMERRERVAADGVFTQNAVPLVIVPIVVIAVGAETYHRVLLAVALMAEKAFALTENACTAIRANRVTTVAFSTVHLSLVRLFRLAHANAMTALREPVMTVIAWAKTGRTVGRMTHHPTIAHRDQQG